MASDLAHPGPGRTADEHVETEPGVTLAVPEADGVPSVRLSDGDYQPTTDPVRQYRARRLALETRVVALERTVKRKDRQLAEVVQQYEQVLDARDRQQSSGSRQLNTGEAVAAFEDGPDVLDRVRAGVRSLLGALRR